MKIIINYANNNFKKSQFSVDFYKQLLNICIISGLIDDSPSKAPNYKEFIENRHDQANIYIYIYIKIRT